MAITFRLKILLVERNMTQKQLAELTGIRPPTVSAICTGKAKQLPVSAVDKICQTLQCQPGDLMTYQPDQ